MISWPAATARWGAVSRFHWAGAALPPPACTCCALFTAPVFIKAMPPCNSAPARADLVGDDSVKCEFGRGGLGGLVDNAQVGSWGESDAHRALGCTLSTLKVTLSCWAAAADTPPSLHSVCLQGLGRLGVAQKPRNAPALQEFECVVDNSKPVPNQCDW